MEWSNDVEWLCLVSGDNSGRVIMLNDWVWLFFYFLCVWLACVPWLGMAMGRGGDQSPRTHPRYFAYVPVPSPSLSKLLDRILIPSPNNNRGSPRVPNPRITNNFFCFRFWVIHIKIKNSNKSKVRNISYINIYYKSHIH